MSRRTMPQSEKKQRNKIGPPVLLMFLAAFLFAAPSMAIEIPLQRRGGVYTLPVRVNGVITLTFILDSGASEVTIPSDVALTLLRAGTISRKDFLPGQRYRLADGSILRGARFRIRKLEVGGLRIYNVPAVVSPVNGPLLLGQSFLSRARHWAIDNDKQLLVISAPKTVESPSRPEEIKPGISIDTWRSTLRGAANEGRAPSRGKMPPSRQVYRTPEGKIPPSR